MLSSKTSSRSFPRRFFSLIGLAAAAAALTWAALEWIIDRRATVVGISTLATPAIQSAYSGAAYGNSAQLGTQAIATLATIVFSGVGTYILFKITDKLVGVRVTDKEEAIGLDETQHGETAYTNFD